MSARSYFFQDVLIAILNTVSQMIELSNISFQFTGHVNYQPAITDPGQKTFSSIRRLINLIKTKQSNNFRDMQSLSNL